MTINLVIVLKKLIFSTTKQSFKSGTIQVGEQAMGSTSRMLLAEAFTNSNDLESYVTHFELLAELQKWKRSEGDPARKIDERPHYFALRLQ